MLTEWGDISEGLGPTVWRSFLGHCPLHFLGCDWKQEQPLSSVLRQYFVAGPS